MEIKKIDEFDVTLLITFHSEGILAHSTLNSVERCKKYAEQFAAGQMSKDEFVDLLNSEQLLGQMKIETQIGLAKIKADTFMAGVKSIVLDTLLKLAVKIL